MGTEKEKYKIAILDNCEIELLRCLRNEKVPVEETLGSYDYILIPGWVWKEVCDSGYRKAYIHALIREGYPVKILPEKKYVKLVNEELTLLSLFDMGIRPYGLLMRYLHRDILKGKEKVDIEYLYEEWISLIYEEWPLAGKVITDSSGMQRTQKKNAGEISIAFLAHVLAYQKKKDVEITIWTHDADCRLCVNEISKQLEKSTYISLRAGAFFSYKNFDNILQELLKNKHIDRSEACRLIDKMREERKITYTRYKEDDTTELRVERIDNERFKELLIDETIDLIW